MLLTPCIKFDEYFTVYLIKTIYFFFLVPLPCFKGFKEMEMRLRIKYFKIQFVIVFLPGYDLFIY